MHQTLNLVGALCSDRTVREVASDECSATSYIQEI